MRYLVLVFIALSSTAFAHASNERMKEIQYRGGVVTFSVPKHWVEHYEPDGGGMFYEDAPDTGTLRLNVITAKSPKPLSADAAYEDLLTMKSFKAESVQRLGNGTAMATSIQHSTEHGQAITIFWWYVANLVRPDYIRFANFSFTVLTSQENSEAINREVQLLAESIKNAKFHSTIRP